MISKKAISPVVATSLLIVVTVVGVVTFQTWFSTFSSALYTQTESDAFVASVSDVTNNQIFIKNPSKQAKNITSIKVNGNDCIFDFPQTLSSGLTSFSLRACLTSEEIDVAEVVVFSKESVVSQEFYVEDITPLPDVNLSQSDEISTADYDWAYELAIQGDLAYTTHIDDDRLVVSNISDPENIVNIDSITDSTNLNTIHDIDVYGDYAYVTARDSDRFTIIDISNPSSMYVTDSYQSSTYLNYPKGFRVKDDIAYVTQANGITILNVSNPSSISLISNLTISETEGFGFHEIKLYDDFAILGSSNLSVVDISNLSSPTLEYNENITQFSYFQSIIIKDKYVILGDNVGTGIYVLDFSSPSSPQIVFSGIPLGWEYSFGSLSSMHLNNNILYIGLAGFGDSLIAIDVLDPKFPIFLRREYIDNPYGIKTSGDHVFATSYGPGSLESFKILN